MRSFTEQAGLRLSSFANRLIGAPSMMRRSLTRGVWPMLNELSSKMTLSNFEFFIRSLYIRQPFASGRYSYLVWKSVTSSGFNEILEAWKFDDDSVSKDSDFV